MAGGVTLTRLAALGTLSRTAGEGVSRSGPNRSRTVADVALQGLLVYARLKLDRSLALVARLPTADAESGGYGIEQPAAGTHRRRIMIGVAMPGLNGIETVKRARQRWPFLRVLYVTGYVDIGRRRAAATRL